MGLLSIFQRNEQTAAKTAKSGRSGKAPARQAPQASPSNPADTAEAVREARARARRRLMGATVLLLLGVIGFPLLFETQPRPIPVDLPIEIPSRNAPGVGDAAGATPAHANGAHESIGGAAANVSAAASAASASVSADAGQPAASEVAGASMPASTVAQSRAYINPSMRPGKHAAAADASASAARPPTIAQTPAPAPSKPAIAVATTATRPAETAHAGPVLPPPTSAATPTATGPTAGDATSRASEVAGGANRFVVQVGAFADDAKMRDARGKVEKLGLKTYTQSVDTPGGKRVRLRVGPFSTRAEADRTASRIKGDGLPAAVLTL